MARRIESLLIAAGVTDIVTVDYNRVSYEHPAIKTMVLPALKDRVARGDNGYAHGFDAVFSISRYERKIALYPAGQRLGLASV